MAKALKTAGMVIAGAALIATGIGAAAGVGLLGASASAVASLGGGWTLFGASLSTLSSVGAGLTAVGTLLTKRPGVATGGSPVQQAYDPSSGLPYPFGRTAVAGRIVYGTVTGPLKEGNKYRLFYSVLSGVRIDGFESFSTNDETVSFTSDAGEGASGTYKNRMWQVRRTGAPDSRSYLRFTATGTKDTPADHGGNPPEWTAQHTLGEMAVSLTACEYDQKVYASDVKPLYVIRAARVYDPRLDSTYPGGAGACRANDENTFVWSENPWLHALTWAMGRYQNGARVLGIGAALAFLPVAQFVEAANIADANGWKIGGTAWSTDDKWAVLRSMAQAGGGECFPLGGKIGCMVNAPRVSLATVEARDIVGPCSAAGTRGRRDRINGAVPRYRSEAHGWEIVAADPIIVAAHVAEDRNQQRTREIDYPYVQDLAQAGQLARYDIENSREFGPITLRLGPKWKGFVPGDALTLNVPDLGLNGQLAVITKRAFDPSTFSVTLELRSETTAKHAFALGQTTTAPPIPTLTGNDALMPGAPPAEDVSVEGGTTAGPDGALPVIVYKVVLANQHATHVIVDYRQIAPTVGEWRSREWPVSSLAVDGDDNPTVSLPLDGLAAGATYQSRIRYRTVRGVEDPATATPLPDATTGGLDAGTVEGKTPAQIVADAGASVQPAIAAVEAAAQAASIESGQALALLQTPGTGVIQRLADVEVQADGADARLTDEVALRTAENAAAVARIGDLEASRRVVANALRNGNAADPQALRYWTAPSGGFVVGNDPQYGPYFGAVANTSGATRVLLSEIHGTSPGDVWSLGLQGDPGGSSGSARAFVFFTWMRGGVQLGNSAAVFLDNGVMSWAKRAELRGVTVPATVAGQVPDGFQICYAVPNGHLNSTFSYVMVNQGAVALPFNDLSTAKSSLARTASLELAQAASDSSLAVLTDRVGVSMQQGDSIVANARFGAYTAAAGIPDGWSEYLNGSAATRQPAPGGRYAPRWSTTATQMYGIVQSVVLTPGDWILEFQAMVTSGDWRGCGLLASYPGGEIGRIDCGVDPDNGGVIGAGGPGYRRFTKKVTVPSPVVVTFYAMATWDGYASGRSAKTIDIQVADVYPVDAAVRAAQADASTALTAYSTLSASFASYQTTTDARFTSPTGEVQVAKSQAIAQSLADANQAISTYDASTTASFGGLRAATGLLQSAMTTVQGRVVAWLKLTASSGSEEAKVEVVADEGGSLIRMVAKAISLANTVGGVVIDVLKIVGGEVFFGAPVSIDVAGKRLTLGPGFGSSSDLVWWFGPSAISVAAMTKINGHFALATDGKVYYGTAELGTGSGNPDAVTGRYGQQSNLAPNTGAHALAVQLDLSGVAASDLVEAKFLITQEVAGALSTTGTWSGGWEIVEQTTAGGSTAVRASGLLTIEDSGGGLLDIQSSEPMDAFMRLPDRTLNGTVRYALRLWRSSGPTITGNGIHAELRVQRTP
ncbi:hypothetical protein SGCZBJ_03875 [Caulobacter zeae]|uniref:Tip attachment protein J domain-containing protein n=1 Tax=Caulobacter zeae TaxID=2055137 RepID=A0A2N5DQ21_9CAUL|nr:hypothetical protein [Caulobacter zeae]PLR28156.1 hypothetical protein SGCZBJ_03875 [Caulobacter zeae]